MPNLTEQVAGERIRAAGGGHPSGHEIFDVLEDLLASPEVVATRLINGRATLNPRRVWPALVRLACLFSAERRAALLTIDEALAMLPPCRPPRMRVRP